MEKRANFALVGLSAIMMMVALISFVVWMSVGWNRQVYNTYVVYMNQAVSGLNPEAPVQFNGVSVGNVGKVILNPQNPQQVVIYLNIKQGTPITQSTIATLASQGITGISYVALSATTADAPMLSAVGNNPYPVIPSVPSFFTQLDALLRGTSSSLQDLLSQENINNITKTIQNIREVTDVLASHSADLGQSISDSSAILNNFSNMTQQGNVAMGSLLNLLVRLNGISSNLEQFSNKLRQNPSILVRGTVPAHKGPGE